MNPFAINPPLFSDSSSLESPASLQSATSPPYFRPQPLSPPWFPLTSDPIYLTPMPYTVPLYPFVSPYYFPSYSSLFSSNYPNNTSHISTTYPSIYLTWQEYTALGPLRTELINRKRGDVDWRGRGECKPHF